MVKDKIQTQANVLQMALQSGFYDCSHSDNCIKNPVARDDYIKKPNSLVADFDKLVPAAEAAMEGKQLQPVIG